MEEKNQIKPDEEIKDTTPENPIIIPVKFNKEEYSLTKEQAIELSQKGMKFDAISNQWEKLKGLAKAENKGTEEFLYALEKMRTEKRIKELKEQCGGNEEIAKLIVELEDGKGETLRGEKEFKEFFPTKNIEELPDEVKNAVAENNGNVLDQYLRYEARQALIKEREEMQKKENTESSVGSQKDISENRSPESEEFIRGIWNN
jgi:hypothetical protein